MEKLKQIRVIYYALIASFISFSAIVIILRKVMNLPDSIEPTSTLVFITPLIMILSILFAYGIYDYKARKAKKTDDTETKQKLFLEATIIKLAFIELAGSLANVTLLLLWRQDYVYILGIVLVFFLLAYPSQLRYERDFEPTI